MQQNLKISSFSLAVHYYSLLNDVQKKDFQTIIDAAKTKENDKKVVNEYFEKEYGVNAFLDKLNDAKTHNKRAEVLQKKGIKAKALPV